jgi:hypothetical protein
MIDDGECPIVGPVAATASVMESAMSRLIPSLQIFAGVAALAGRPVQRADVDRKLHGNRQAPSG